jgi:hypothetical protein
MTKGTGSSIELVSGILQNYADRGVFRGFSQGPVRAGKAVFKLSWHRDRLFELVLDVPKKTLRFPVVLPDIPEESPMYREFQEWVEARHSAELPEHRRIDPKKVHLKAGKRGGSASLTLTVKRSEFEYGVRKLIHTVHETYMVFLNDGRYYDYMVETFDIDPDRF